MRGDQRGGPDVGRPGESQTSTGHQRGVQAEAVGKTPGQRAWGGGRNLPILLITYARYTFVQFLECRQGKLKDRYSL